MHLISEDKLKEVEFGKIKYRYFGNTGLSVSVLGFGNWYNAHNPDSYKTTRDCMKVCHENGINFFDTAEAYGFGEAEKQMG